MIELNNTKCLFSMCLFSFSWSVRETVFLLFHWLLQQPSAASWPQWQIITIIILSAQLLSPKCFPWTPPPPHPDCILLISPSGACRVAWISYNILSIASSINGTTRSSSVIWGKHFYRQVGGAQSEWFTAGAGAGGGGGGGVQWWQQRWRG